MGLETWRSKFSSDAMVSRMCDLYVRLVQVKAGSTYLSGVEREPITALPANVSREYWRFPDRCRAPLIERL